ncbi:hypothetical protein ACROYT_G008281 [Oculina patagonica]
MAAIKCKTFIIDAFCFKEADKAAMSLFVLAASTECHRRGEVRDYLLKVAVSGEVSVLGGIAAASAKYQRKERTSNEREIMSLSSSVYTRKGFFVSDKETPSYVDNGMSFKVEGIEIGLEEILIVTTEVEREQKRTEDKLDVEVRVLFFTISAKMENIHQSSSHRGFVLIDHYSSKTGEWRHLEFDTSGYQDAMTELHRIEAGMSVIPDVVKRTPYNQLSRLRLVVRPCAQDAKNFGVFVELQNEIKTLQLQIAEYEAFGASEKTERLSNFLKELQSLTIKNCSWEFLDRIKKNIKQVL